MGSLAKPVVCIVTPGTRSDNNGNWRTAARWAQMLRERYRVIVQTAWDGNRADALIALHARRSAGSIADFHALRDRGGLAVVLTGTDLYADLPRGSPEARASIALADRLVVLQDDAPRLLDPALRRKTEVIFQSARPLPARRKAMGRLDCVIVGHLREEKDPRTLFAAMGRIPAGLRVTVRHIGAPLDAGLEAAARELERRDARYRYAGALSRGLTRAAIARAHVLVHPSVVEGGANVIVEAITSGTSVIASRISGNVGMLGASYPGLFEARDASGLASRIVRAAEEAAYRKLLAAACAKRRPLFRPEAEQRALRRLVAALVA